MKLPNGRNEKPHLSSTFLKNAQYDSAYTVYVLSCFICPWLLVCSWDWYIEQIYNFFYVLCINHDSGNLKMICAMYQLWFWKFENECCCLGVIALEQTRRKICSDRSTGHSRRTQWAQVNVQIAMWFQEKKKQVIRVSVTIRNIIIRQDALTWLARADDGTSIILIFLLLFHLAKQFALWFFSSSFCVWKVDWPGSALDPRWRLAIRRCQSDASSCANSSIRSQMG